MVPPPAATKTRLPAGFLTTPTLLYNQCLPSLVPGGYTENTRMHTNTFTLSDINKNASSCA